VVSGKRDSCFRGKFFWPDVLASGGRGMGRAGRRFGGDAGVDGWMEGGG